MARVGVASSSARCILACAAVCVGAVNAEAQATSAGGPDPALVRLRIGPLMLNPTIALTNAGVDDNVFNDPESSSPKRDFTVTITPATDLWLPFGPTWLTSSIREDINWYRRYASERSANTSYTAGWRVPLSRMLFKVSTALSETRDRPGFEIDARAQRSQVGFAGSAEFRPLSRTFIGATASRDRTSFADDATFRSTNLHDELSRSSVAYGLTVREQVTTLTSITVAVTRAQDRFEFSPGRDSAANNVVATVAFDPQALLKGSASVGYTDFTPNDAALPGFRGVTTDVSLSYLPLESTKLSFTATRSVQYSYDLAQPYYVLTGFTGSIAQQIFGPVDVVGRIGRQTLGYRDRAGAVIAAPNRTDEVFTYGSGIGYHLGGAVRLGFNIDHSKRTSPLDERTYQGLRFGTSLTYGI